MKDWNFIINTLAAILYNCLFTALIFKNPENEQVYGIILFLIAGLHLVILLGASMFRMLKFRKVGTVGFTILSVLMVNIIFWLLFPFIL